MKKSLIFFPYCFLISIIIILADMDKLPLNILIIIPHYDWAAHFVLYGLSIDFLIISCRKKEFV